MSKESDRRPLVCYTIGGATQLFDRSSIGGVLSGEAVRRNTNALRLVLESLPAEAKRGDIFAVMGPDDRQHLATVRHAGVSTAEIEVDGLERTSRMRLLLSRVGGVPSLRWVVLDAVAAETATRRPYALPRFLLTGQALQIVVATSDAPGVSGVSAVIDSLAQSARNAIKGGRRAGRLSLPGGRAAWALGVRRLGSRVVIHGGECQPD